MKWVDFGPVFLRMSMSLVFLWFGINQVTNTQRWVAFVPEWVSLDASLVVRLNGISEIVLGLLLLTGIFTKIVATLLGLHLLGIAFSIGYTATGIRDAGLSLATIAIAFNGSDKYCIENKWKSKHIYTEDS